MKERAWCLAMCLGGGVALAFANAYGIPCLSNNVTACLINGGIDGLDRPMVLLADLLLLKLTCAGGESVLAYLRRRLELTVGASIVNRVFARMLRAKPSFFEGMDSEGAVRRALRDAETLAAWRVALWSDLPLALAAGVLAVGTMFCGGWNCPALGIVAQQGCPMLAVVVLVLSPTHFLFLIWNRRFAREEQRQAEASEAQYAVGIEMLRGIADLRAACAFAFADNRMGKSTGSAVRAQSRVQALLSFLQGTDNAVASLAEVSLIAVAARMIVLPGSGFGYADYVGFVALQMAFHAALSRIVDMAFSWLKAKPAARRISELESVPQIVTGEERMTAEGGGAAPSVRLCHVTVTTETGARILSNMTFSARSGEHVALVGPSGCGKSTLLKVVARQQGTTCGEMWLDGCRCDRMPFGEYASRVALVSQRPFLFAGTVRENILLGRGVGADGYRLNRIAAGIGIPDELLHRSVRTDGRGLSGGQMAKIALARAVFGEPQVLLLDEVTAALDDQSERRVLDFIAEQCKSQTILFVTHRRSSMEAMDRVCELFQKDEEGGR